MGLCRLKHQQQSLMFEYENLYLTISLLYCHTHKKNPTKPSELMSYSLFLLSMKGWGYKNTRLWLVCNSCFFYIVNTDQEKRDLHTAVKQRTKFSFKKVHLPEATQYKMS